MRKGVAVPYIIAILLGVAVIGLVGYWLFGSAGKIGPEEKRADCNIKLSNYCNEGVRVGSIAGLSWDSTCNNVLSIPAASAATGTTGNPSPANCASVGITGLPTR